MKRMFRFWNNFLLLAVFLYSRGVLSDVMWPDGTYGLPMPNVGCPHTPNVTWQTGWVLQDMDKESGYAHSNPFNLKSDLRKNIKRHFCMKTSTLNKDKILWPPGKYCIYRYGGSCPAHMRNGYYEWDDEYYDNKNSQRGRYPDGIYNRNTRIYFCCRTNGDKNVPLSLPTSRPFFLLAQGGSECQQVKWALATAEWLTYDTAGNGERGAVYPYNGNLDDPTIFYCYYQSCNNTLSGDNGTLKSPNYPAPVPRGQFCSWSITVDPGYQVSLKFTEFYSSCNETEQLEVYDGTNDTAPILDVFTVNNPPPAFGVNSTSNNMYIILKSTTKPVTGVNSGTFLANFTKQEPSVIVATTEAITTALTKNTNPTVTGNSTYTEATREPTKSSFQSSSIPEQATSHGPESLPTEHASGNSSARSGANTWTGNWTLVVAVVVPLVIILIVVIGLFFLWKKRRNRKPSPKGVLRVMYDGNEETTKRDIANPIYETQLNDTDHCLNPIYDSGTENEVTHATLQIQQDQNCEEKESDNPLYQTAESNDKGQLRGDMTYKTDENPLYSSADNDNSDVQPGIEEKSLLCAGQMNEDNANGNLLCDASQPSAVINPIYDL